MLPGGVLVLQPGRVDPRFCPEWVAVLPHEWACKRAADGFCGRRDGALSARSQAGLVICGRLASLQCQRSTSLHKDIMNVNIEQPAACSWEHTPESAPACNLVGMAALMQLPFTQQHGVTVAALCNHKFTCRLALTVSFAWSI